MNLKFRLRLESLFQFGVRVYIQTHQVLIYINRLLINGRANKLNPTYSDT